MVAHVSAVSPEGIFKLERRGEPSRGMVTPWSFLLEIKSWKLLLTEIGPGQVFVFYERLYSNTDAIETQLHT
jgi:hypothetical protein